MVEKGLYEMKKLKTVAVIALLCIGSTVHAAIMNWATYGGYTIVGPGGATPLAGMNDGIPNAWGIYLFSDPLGEGLPGLLRFDGTTDGNHAMLGPLDVSGRDTWVDHQVGGLGYFAESNYNDTDFGLGIGSDVFTIIVNAATLGIATDWAPFTGGGTVAGIFTIPDYGFDVAFNYDAGSVGSGDWLAIVPEPGTMALFGLGLLTLATRLRRRK